MLFQQLLTFSRSSIAYQHFYIIDIPAIKARFNRQEKGRLPASTDFTASLKKHDNILSRT